MLLLFALSLSSLATGLVQAATRLIVATMTVIIMVVVIDSTIVDVIFDVVVQVFVFIDPDARVIGDQGHTFARSA